MNLKQYLESEPRARQRSNKNRALGNLIITQYNLQIDKGTMADIVGEVLSLDRQWRKLLEENEHLRGTDYSQKTILEQQKQIELGYEGGYYTDKKRLENLTIQD